MLSRLDRGWNRRPAGIGTVRWTVALASGMAAIGCLLASSTGLAAGYRTSNFVIEAPTDELAR